MSLLNVRAGSWRVMLAVLCVAAGQSVVGMSAAPASAGETCVRVEPPEPIVVYEPLTYRNDEWYGSTFWTGPDWTRVGRNWHHPGNNTPSVRCFVAPRDGHVTVSGRVFKADTNNGGGDGIRAFIRRNGGEVWQGQIDGGDTEGVTHAVEMDVREGDAIRFIVHKRGAIPYDTTYWDPAITYADGSRFQASEGFSASVTDDSPWRYEMDKTTSVTADKDTRAYVFTRDLLLESVNLERADDGLSITARDHLPLVVVACRGGQGGTLVTLADGGDWTVGVGLPDSSGNATVRWTPADAEAPRLTPYAGGWPNVLAEEEVQRPFDEAFRRLQVELGVAAPALPPRLWAMVVDAWLHEDGRPKTASDLIEAARGHVDRCQGLLDGLHDVEEGFRAQAQEAVDRLGDRAEASAQAGSVYVAVRRLKRELLLRRPEWCFDHLLFCKRVPTSYSHLVMQYYGWRARPGGGLFVLDRPGYSLDARDLLDGQLETGSVLQPSLHWDGRRVVFSYVENAGRSFDPATLDNETDDGFFHLWTVNVDGSGLQQITGGPYDDLMPAWLPDGGVVFCSTRRRGYARCFGAQFSPRWDSYTLHRVEADGSGLALLSCNDVSEWFPVVANDGRVLYSRWDYIDRDAVTHQNLWSTRPDGTNPMAVWGNALPSPHCTFQIQPIPDSDKLVFVASAHHSITAGSLVVVDPKRGENAVDAMQRITPEIPFPETETRDIPSWYAAPWPLAEDLFLTAYSPHPLVWEPGANRRDALGIYLVDAAGNRELIYRDPDIGATNPVPLRPRPMPPALAPSRDPEDEDAVFFVADVYEGLNGVAARDEVKRLRVIQIFPKVTPLANTPRIGLAGEENGRAVLGTVPVAADGSGHFRAPAAKPLLFQLLDARGRAIQTMRSLTYAQPGERVSCVGCHEGRGRTIQSFSTEAGRRTASVLEAGPCEREPFSFMRVVQPVLDEHCIRCHSGDDPPRGVDLTGAPDRGFTRSYWSLCGSKDAGKPPAAEGEPAPLVPRFLQRNQIQITPPGGPWGARGSRLLHMLEQGHNKVRLSEDAVRRLAMWIDCNAIFYGANLPERQALQLAGKTIPMPEIQ